MHTPIHEFSTPFALLLELTGDGTVAGETAREEVLERAVAWAEKRDCFALYSGPLLDTRDPIYKAHGFRDQPGPEDGIVRSLGPS